MPLEIKVFTEKMGAEKVHTLPVDAYRVDKPAREDGPILRDKLEMGSFCCCDYIVVKENTVLLIEDTNLIQKRNDLERKCLCFIQEKEDKETFSVKIIKNENLLKAYGSLLLLYRLMSQSTEGEKLIQNKDIHFWLVVNDGSSQDSRVFDNLRDTMQNSLRKLVANVAVHPLEKLEQELNNL